MNQNNNAEEPTNDFDLIPEKKPALSTVTSQTKESYGLIESSIALSGTKIKQTFDRLKIWVDLNKHGRSIEFKLGKNMKISAYPYLTPPEQYIRMTRDIGMIDIQEDERENITNADYDDEVIRITDRKNKYINCTIDYSIYKQTVGINNIYINKDILIIDITGKLMAYYGDLGLISIKNIRACLKKLIDLNLFKFDIDKFLKYAGCYLADVTVDVNLIDEKKVKRMVNAISSFLPIISKDYDNRKYKNHGLMIKKRAESAGYSLSIYHKKYDINRSILRETKAVKYTEIIGDAGEWFAERTLRLEAHLFKMSELRKFLGIKMVEKGFVPLMAVLRSNRPVILDMLKEIGIDEGKLYERLSWFQANENFLKEEKNLTIEDMKEIALIEWVTSQIKNNDFRTDITKAHILTEYSFDLDCHMADNIMRTVKTYLLNFLCYRKPKSISLVLLLIKRIQDIYFESSL